MINDSLNANDILTANVTWSSNSIAGDITLAGYADTKRENYYSSVGFKDRLQLTYVPLLDGKDVTTTYYLYGNQLGGSKPYHDVLFVRCNDRFARYDVDKSQIITFPDIAADYSAELILLTSDGGTGDSVTVNIPEGTETDIRKAVLDTCSDMIDAALEEKNYTRAEVDITVALNVSQKPKSDDSGVQSISLDIDPYLTVVKPNENAGVVIGSKKIYELNEAIPITVTVSFKPEIIRHFHIGTGDTPATTEYITPTETKQNEDGTWTVTWLQRTFSVVELVPAGEVRRGVLRYAFHDGRTVETSYLESDCGTALERDARSGYTFDGWMVNGVAYTALTDELLTAILDETVTATPRFTKNAQTTPAGNDGSAPANDGSYDYDYDYGTDVSGGSAGSGGESAASGTPSTSAAEGDDGDAIVITPEELRAAAASGRPVTVPVASPVAAGPAEAEAIEIRLPDALAGRNVRLAIPVRGAGVSTVAVLVRDDGTEELIKDCVLTDGGLVFDVNGSVRVRIIDNGKRFGDVSEAYWGSDAVQFVAARGIFNGIGGGSFAPDAGMNRGMLAQVLFNFDRSSGADAASAGFTDVPDGVWYTAAVNWCAGERIINGYEDGSFRGDRVITRQELVTCLYRYAQRRGLPTEGGTDFDRFADSEKVQSYAQEAMRWAVGSGLIVGSDGLLDPDGQATRAQVATIMMRFCYLTK